MIRLRDRDAKQTLVGCQGETHRLEYRDGALHALDHDDVDGELALAALGGPAVACAELVDAWRRHCTDLRVLVLASRGAADQLADIAVEGPGNAQPVPASQGPFLTYAMPAPFPTTPGVAFSSSYASTLSIGPAGMQPGQPELRLDPLSRLFALDRAMRQRLVATVVRTWTERLEAGKVAPDLPALQVALISRAQAALAEWNSRPGEDGGEDVGKDVEVVMLAPGTAPTVDTGGRLRIGLPFSWLADVWAPGISQLLGRFTLSARELDGAIHLDTLDAALHRASLVVAEA